MAASGAAADPGQGSAALLLVAPRAPRSLTDVERQLRRMVVGIVAAPTSKAAYGHALDQILAFAGGRPLSRVLLNEWRSSMESLAASTINGRLSAVHRLVQEARHAGIRDARGGRQAQQCAQHARARDAAQQLAHQRAGESAAHGAGSFHAEREARLRHPGSAGRLRDAQRKLAALDVAEIQMRENRWAIVDLRGKSGRVRTVAVPLWVKHAINA